MLLHGHPGMPSWYLALMLGVAVLFLVTVPLVYRRFGTAYALFVGISIVMPASTGLLGLDRYVIVAFPVFAALAVSWKKEVLTGLAALGFCAGPVFAALFAGGLTV